MEYKFTLPFCVNVNLNLYIFLTTLLRATRGAHNLNLQVVIVYAAHVCSRHSFGLPLRMNGIYRMQLDQSPLGLLSLGI